MSCSLQVPPSLVTAALQRRSVTGYSTGVASADGTILQGAGWLRSWLTERFPSLLVVSYLPHNTFHVVGAAAEVARVHDQAEVVLSTTLLHYVHKLSKELVLRAFASVDETPVTLPTKDNVIDLHVVALNTGLTSSAQLQRDLSSAVRALGSDLQRRVSIQARHRTDGTVRVELSALSNEQSRGLLRSVTEALGGLVSVSSVEVEHPAIVLNDDAVSLVQSGRSNADTIRNLGLLGDEQTIAIGDSWLDVNQCFFVDTPALDVCTDFTFMDSSYTFSAEANRTFQVKGCLPGSANTDHRKVAGYWTFYTNTLLVDGSHGTHVAGTAAGTAFKPTTISRFNGAAPNAKVVFTQIGVNARQIFSPLLNLVYASIYFGWSYAMGARIHSNSWGGPGWTDEYSDESASIDKFVVQQRDMLVLFAAGNDGEKLPRQYLSPQAQAKNALIVGSSQSSNAHFIEEVAPRQARDKFNRLYRQNALPLCDSEAVSTVFGCINSVLVQAGQSPINSLNGMTTTLCRQWFLSNSSCTTPSVLSSCPLPAPYATRMSLVCPDALAAAYLQHDAAQYNEHTVSSFSLYGPTADGRIKPDVVAPGDIVLSANSHADQETDYSCSSAESDIVAMAGTSMATPLVAGSAALVRQFYAQGYHVDGVMNASASIAPSAALMKATLIVSAVHATSWGKCTAFDPISCSDADVTWLNSSSAYTRAVHEGFGIVQLDQVLSLAGNSTIPGTDVTLFAYDVCSPFQLLAQGQSQSYTFTVTNISRPFKATLVWTDPVADASAAIQLVNNLDLSVTEVATGSLYWGNGDIYAVNQPDHINNVETVWIAQPAGGVYNVTVTAHAINDGVSQDYALVVTFLDGTASTPSTTTSCTFNSLTIETLNTVLAGEPAEFFAPTSTGADAVVAATSFSKEVVVGLSVGLGLVGLVAVVLAASLCWVALRWRTRGGNAAPGVEMGKPQTFHRLSISAVSASVNPAV